MPFSFCTVRPRWQIHPAINKSWKWMTSNGVAHITQMRTNKSGERRLWWWEMCKTVREELHSGNIRSFEQDLQVAWMRLRRNLRTFYTSYQSGAVLSVGDTLYCRFVVVWGRRRRRGGDANDSVSEHFVANHREIIAPWGLYVTSKAASWRSRVEK